VRPHPGPQQSPARARGRSPARPVRAARLRTAPAPRARSALRRPAQLGGAACPDSCQPRALLAPAVVHAQRAGEALLEAAPPARPAARALARGARRLLGMFRTVTNIWGDCCAVTVVETWAKRYDAKLARQAKKTDAVAGAPSDRVEEGKVRVDARSKYGLFRRWS
jgi:hypothetical protein